jgi:armadillo repeat-containing protein 8
MESCGMNELSTQLAPRGFCPFTPQTNTMTIQTVNVSTLKRVKNNVIGNPSAKLSLAQDELFVTTSVACLSSSRFPSKPPSSSLVKCINAPEQFEEAAGSQDDVRVEAAHVITSLSYGTQA